MSKDTEQKFANKPSARALRRPSSSCFFQGSALLVRFTEHGKPVIQEWQKQLGLSGMLKCFQNTWQSAAPDSVPADIPAALGVPSEFWARSTSCNFKLIAAPKTTRNIFKLHQSMQLPATNHAKTPPRQSEVACVNATPPRLEAWKQTPKIPQNYLLGQLRILLQHWNVCSANLNQYQTNPYLCYLR